MRYRLPGDCAGVAHGGVLIARAPDGTIEMDAGAAPALAPHGIVPAAETDEPGVAKKSDDKPNARRSRSEDRRMLR